MSDLRISEAFLYMDYLVGAGQGWRVAPRTSTCPMSLRLEEQPFCFLSLGWDAFGVLSPAASSELCRDSEGWQLRRCDRSSQGVVELTGKGAARASGSLGRGAHGRSPRDGAAAAGRLLPVVGFLLLCVLLQRTFFPRKQEFPPVPLAELQVLLKSHNRNGLLSAR